MNKRTTLLELEKTIHAIKTEVLNSEEIKKLLMHSTPDALEKGNVSRDVAKESIVVVPYIDEQNPDKELNMNTFLAIYQSSIIYADSGENSVFLITAVYTNHDLYLLDNNSFRLNQIGHHLESILNNKKFNLVGQLSLYESRFVSLAGSKKLGLIMSWEIVNA